MQNQIGIVLVGLVLLWLFTRGRGDNQEVEQSDALRAEQSDEKYHYMRYRYPSFYGMRYSPYLYHYGSMLQYPRFIGRYSYPYSYYNPYYSYYNPYFYRYRY